MTARMRTVSVGVRPHTKFAQDVTSGPHHLVSDEQPPAGEDLGPESFEFLLAALGNCTAFTLRLYANRKGWPLTGVKVDLDGERSKEGQLSVKRRIHLEGPLDDEQRARLLEIAGRCPVHKALSQPSLIESALA